MSSFQSTTVRYERKYDDDDDFFFAFTLHRVYCHYIANAHKKYREWNEKSLTLKRAHDETQRYLFMFTTHSFINIMFA